MQNYYYTVHVSKILMGMYCLHGIVLIQNYGMTIVEKERALNTSRTCTM